MAVLSDIFSISQKLIIVLLNIFGSALHIVYTIVILMY